MLLKDLQLEQINEHGGKYLKGIMGITIRSLEMDMNIGTGVERDSPLSKGLRVVLSQLKSVNVILPTLRVLQYFCNDI